MMTGLALMALLYLETLPRAGWTPCSRTPRPWRTKDETLDPRAAGGPRVVLRLPPRQPRYQRNARTLVKLAEEIATAHQSEVPLAKMLVALDKRADIYHAIAEKLAVNIYDYPRFQSAGSQQQFIDKMRDLVHAKCLVEIHCSDCRPAYSPYRY